MLSKDQGSKSGAFDEAGKKFVGKIKRGEVRNPNGRPRKVWTAEELMDKRIKKDLRAVAKEHSPEAFRFLLNTMRNEDAALQHRMNAATQILDRGFGKPSQHNEVTVSVLDRMSDQELIKIITGVEIEGEVIEQARRELSYDGEENEDDES